MTLYDKFAHTLYYFYNFYLHIYIMGYNLYVTTSYSLDSACTDITQCLLVILDQYYNLLN